MPIRASVRLWIIRCLVILVALYALLLIPDPQPSQPKGAGKEQFLWSRDAFWSALEADFLAMRALRVAERATRFVEALEQFHRALDPLGETNLPPDSPMLDSVEIKVFQLAPIAAAHPERLSDFKNATGRLHNLVKWQSERWSSDSAVARQRIYRLLYGTRAAVEEALLQSSHTADALELHSTYHHDETPFAMVQGVKVHSGDILLSRGGAATSALIARGNDFPGNFSHIALVHVNEQTKAVSVIEAHIESGVGVRPIEAYLQETKLRIMALRLRSDISAMEGDPMLPHKAATFALTNTLAHHIPYDFAMDCADPSQQFCSEVASSAYSVHGVKLWTTWSHISTPGVTAWLAALGVRHFETQEPSDLEYDPQLRVVAEWRDPDTLFKDHVDNAVIDAMLEGAERGEKLDYNLWMLPPARLAKIWSVVKNLFGGVGPIPEGMSAATALRADGLKQRHAAMVAGVMQEAEQFKAERGYTPPYWELVRFAREAHGS